MEKYSYDLNKFNFAEIVRRRFEVRSLEDVDSILEGDLRIPTAPSEDQKTTFHKIFYGLYEEENSPFLVLYERFIEHLVGLHYPNCQMAYQKKPTFRVQAPNNIAVAKWHKDKEYNHSRHELNIYLPLTRAFDTNTIWCEKEEDKGDYAPIEAEVGEYCIWDGANLNHGNKKNTTGCSRVSLDFRIIDFDKFNYQGSSITTKVPMKLGHYWKLCKS